MSAVKAGWLALGRTIIGFWCLNPWSAMMCKSAGNTGRRILLTKFKQSNAQHTLDYTDMKIADY